MFENAKDEILREMSRKNVVFTRHAYLNLKYPRGLPSPWTEAHERELPSMFRGERGRVGS